MTRSYSSMGLATGHDQQQATDVTYPVEDPGCEPEPIERHEEDSVARAFQCSRYRHCNDVAVLNKWKGWDCMACPSTINKQEIPSVNLDD